MLDSQKKSPNSISALGVFVFVAGLVIIGFNYWHAMKCVETNGLGDMGDYIRALEKRINQVEAKVQLQKIGRAFSDIIFQAISNSKLAENLISEMQARLITLDSGTMKNLVKNSKDEAVLMAVQQALLPAPPVSQYIIEDKYEMANEVGNFMDDKFNPDAFREGENYFDVGNGGISFENEFQKFDDFTGGSGGAGGEVDGFPQDDFGERAEERGEAGRGDGAGFFDLTEADEAKCRSWLEDYGVVPGVSWGSLPKALQVEWSQSSCDQMKI